MGEFGFRSTSLPNPQGFEEHRQCLPSRIINGQLAVEEAIDLCRAVSVVIGEVARRIALSPQFRPQTARLSGNEIANNRRNYTPAHPLHKMTSSV